MADLQAHKIVDEAYQDRTSWIKKSIRTGALTLSVSRQDGALMFCVHIVAFMGKFSSDRAIMQYAEEVRPLIIMYPFYVSLTYVPRFGTSNRLLSRIKVILR